MMHEAAVAPLEASAGLVLGACAPGSSLAQIGLQVNDVVMAVNGVPLRRPEDYVAARKLLADRIEMKILRGREFVDLVVMLVDGDELADDEDDDDIEIVVEDD